MGEVTPAQIIEWLAMGIGLVGVWFRMQFKIERIEEKHMEHVTATAKKHGEFDRQIDAIWKWKDDHEADSVDTRETLNKEISELRGSMLVNSEQFKQVLGLLTEIKERLTRLENRN